MSGTGEPSTATLLARAASGDRAAVDSLLTIHRDRLRRMVALRIDSRLAARLDPSDIVQETLLAAAGQISEYLADPSVPFYLWLRGIAWNRLVDAYRHHLVRQSRSLLREQPFGLNDDSAHRLVDRFLGDRGDPLGKLIRDELKARLRETLAKLDPIDQEILLLHHLEQLSLADCATVLQINLPAAKKRYVRAMDRLRVLFGPMDQ